MTDPILTEPPRPEMAAAAFRAVAQHLAFWPDSMARDDLWENAPELTEAESEDALALADSLVRSAAEAILQHPAARLGSPNEGM